MAKFLEVPTKPHAVYAVQFTGADTGVPMFSEASPSWLVSALIRGKLTLENKTLYFGPDIVAPGSWLVVDADDLLGDGMRVVSALVFISRYRPARKKPGPRSKAKTAHFMAAE